MILILVQYIYVSEYFELIFRAHSFPQAAEFRAELWNFPFSMEF